MENEKQGNRPAQQELPGSECSKTTYSSDFIVSSDTTTSNGAATSSAYGLLKSQEPETYKVFVYGTLRKGYHNHHYLDGESDFIGKAKSVEKYSMTAEERYMRGYRKRAIPFVSKKPEIEITGEIFEVSKYTLKLLDALESHPRWYKREEVEFVIIEDENHVDLGLEDRMDIEKKPKRVVAWIYFNEETIGQITILSGDFSIEYPLAFPTGF